MGDVHHCRVVVSEMTYTVSSGTLNSTIPYCSIATDTLHYTYVWSSVCVWEREA